MPQFDRTMRLGTADDGQPTRAVVADERAFVNRGWLRWSILALSSLVVPSTGDGQTVFPPREPLLGWTLDSHHFRDLPTSNNPFAVLETIHAEAIGDGFTSAGLNVATPLRFGAFLNSWTQTEFRIDDISVTDPRTGGVPLLLPILSFWERMTTETGAMQVDTSAPGLSVTLAPRRPGTTWIREIEGSVSGAPLVRGWSGSVPAVDRVDLWGDGTALTSGPVTDRLGLVAAGSWRGLSHVAAPNTTATTDRAASAFAHLVLAATSRDEVRTLGWVQRLATPQATDTGVHAQTTWERRDPAGVQWRVFGGYTERRRTMQVPSTLVAESLATDPISDLMDPGAGVARRWTFGARAAPTATRQHRVVGVEIEGTRLRVAPTEVDEIRELVDGVPSRLWTVHAGAGPDARRLTTVAAYANERLTFSRLTLDAGLRLETIAGSAEGAVRGIRWTTWMPRAMLRWDIEDFTGLSAVASYRRSAYQLPLNVLAVGSPAAPVADVAVWNGASVGPLVARVGPGTGGDGAFTDIDPRLERPITDELVLSLESRPVRGLLLYLARVTKREEPLLDFVNTGIDQSDYTAFEVPDLLFDPILSPFGAEQVTVYDRPSGSYGRDRYRLTNRASDSATSWAIKFGGRVETERFILFAGGVYSRAYGPAAAVGFLPTQNDQDVLGNLFVDPNDETHPRGQLFQDRSHVGKIAGVVRFPGRIRLGAIARYHDGQPFARVVVVPNLTQGPTAVRAFRNGGSAFTYTHTFDIRLQKDLTAGRAEVTAVLDVYNLTGYRHEVAEYIVTAPGYRTPTVLQPPRTAVVGVRATF